MVLQAGLSRRDAGSRTAADGLERVAARCAGWLFAWKLTLLATTVASSVVVYRPFCRFVCPLGAIYGLLNRISFVQLTFKETHARTVMHARQSAEWGGPVSERHGSGVHPLRRLCGGLPRARLSLGLTSVSGRRAPSPTESARLRFLLCLEV